jgi:triosephosphate isomerase
MRKKIVAGNWKMNKSLQEAVELCNQLNHSLPSTLPSPHIQVVICPPFPYLLKAMEVFLLLDNQIVKIGAQNCHHQAGGAYTGEVSAPMLRSMNIPYVIIGHSERREYFKETDELLKAKIDIALAHDLTPIFCCGEKLELRETGKHFETVHEQIKQGLFHLNSDDMTRIVIAYEPVWAIGTGKTATKEQAQEMHASIRRLIAQQYNPSLADNITILYGGSCTPANAQELFAQPDVDGGLIGGASLKAADFSEIVNQLMLSV